MPLSGPGVLAGYLDDIRERGYDDDPNQRRIAQALDALRAALAQTQSTSGHWPFSRRRQTASVRGLYIYGDVGRGKTYLMDMFYERLVERRKLRQHFHRFMQDIHFRLGELRDRADPLKHVAADIAERYRLICFDEFFVSDIADAMLLGTLFSELFTRGVTLVATSNVAPDDLYRDGLQRARFLPAIDQIKAHCDVIETTGAHDYRLRLLTATDAFRVGLNDDTEAAMRADFKRLAPGGVTGPGHMSINFRQVAFIRRAVGIAWFSFDALCRGPRGTADYIDLARCFGTVMVSDVPQLDSTMDNEARRFIALIDEFYDRRVNVILSAAVALDELYCGSKLEFEFRRTFSRLQEMQSEAYLASPHLQEA
jgi:cell division protein ZapE